MLKPTKFSGFAASLAAAFTLSGCQTVKMPKIDIMKSPEFSEDAANISKDFPRVKDAPQAPTDIRSDAQWDDDARALQALRDSPRTFQAQPGLTEAEARAQYQALKAKAQAYKLDDPASGPVDLLPDYKPGR